MKIVYQEILGRGVAGMQRFEHIKLMIGDDNGWTMTDIWAPRATKVTNKFQKVNSLLETRHGKTRERHEQCSQTFSSKLWIFFKISTVKF